MKNITDMNSDHETTIPEPPSMIAGKGNNSHEEECKSTFYILSGGEVYTKHQPGTIPRHHISNNVENAIEDILHCIYKDVLRSYEEAKTYDNCNGEKLLSHHIFNEVDFVAKSMFPGIKFI